jgi:ribosome maturation factor RimP
MEKREKEQTLEKIEKVVQPVLEELKLSLVDIEYLQEGGYWYVRIYIEKENGEVTLEDCATVSNRIDEAIDALIEERFFLEVSSPGVERPLKKPEDYVRFTGEKAKLSLKHKLKDQKNWEGYIEKFENDTIYLDVETEILEIPFKEVRKANLVFEFEEF